MGNLLWSGGTFQVFCDYNLLQWNFVCDFKCIAVGLLLSEKGSTLFTEFTFDVFDLYSQSAIFFSYLYLVYIYVADGPLPASSKVLARLVRYLML